MAGGGGTGRALLSLSFSSSTLLSRSLLSSTKLPLRHFRPLSLSTATAAATPATPATTDTPLQPLRHSILLDRIRSRHLKDAAAASPTPPKGSPPRRAASEVVDGGEVGKKKEKKMGVAVSSFEELGLSEEVMGALKEMEISVPTEIQCIGVPAVLEGKSVVLGSHTGSGKTLAYMLPLVQGISDLNRLITSFAKAGDLVSAREVFEKMIERDVVSWNSMMSAYAHDGWYNQVLQTFSEMHQQGVKPSQTSFSIILSSCARFKCLTFGKLIHSLSIKAGSSTNEFVGTSLITMYSECNASDYLMKVFNDFEHRNVASWNALISGFLLNGLVEDAHEVFNHMPCRNVVSWTVIIHGYVEIKKVRSALELFNLMPVKNSVSWSVMLGGFVSNGQYEEALALFKKILSSGTKVTVAIILKVVNACLGLKSPKVGKKIHGYVIKLGFGLDPGIEASLITMYFGCLSSQEAKSVFDNMDSKFVGSWNSLINGYINNDEVDKARKWFDRMTERDKMSWNLMIHGYLRANRVDDALELFSLIPEFTIEAYTGLISCFIENGKVGKARQLFDAMPERDVTAYTAMIYGHLEEGSLNDALELFIEMPTRNAVTYNIMISGLAHHGKIKQAYQIFNETPKQGAVAWNALVVGFARNEVNSEVFLLFRRMILSGVSPNESAVASILSASASLSALRYGESVHGASIKYGFGLCFIVMNSLISMYAKCGNMSKAKLVFNQMDEHDLVTWNTLIYGYGVNGFGMESIAMFEEMHGTGIKPDAITYLGVLSACMHNCLLEQAQHYFERMKCDDGIEPNLTHYACIVDLLCRKGFVEKAEHLIYSMPFESDSVIWTSVLSGCRLNCNVRLAEHAAIQLFKLIPGDPMPYLHLIDIYRSAGRWTESEKLRTQMNKLGINKKPGFTWTDINSF